MQTHKNNNGFTDRLAACVERVGGKRAMATNALISEAQLFRYLNGESDVPSDRLVAIAKASGVDAGWLLTGGGDSAGPSTDKRPAFRGELMVQVVQLLEELLVEFEKPFNPRQRARAITFIYNALRHTEMRTNVKFEPQKFDLMKYASFLAELRTEEELELLISGMEFLEYSDNVSVQEAIQLLRTWSNLLVRGMKGYYSSYPGQVYFERKTGGQLEAEEILDLQNLVMELYKITSKNALDWLDLGCGAGQHLMHLYKHMPNLNLRGIELSQLGYSICKEAMDSARLPKDSVVMGDMRHLSFESESMDVVFANMSLHHLLYIPGTGLGIEEALDEVARVLRPGGVLAMIMPEGNGRDYLLPRQYIDKPTLEKLAGNSFRIERCTSKTLSESYGNRRGSFIPNPIQMNFNQNLVGLLVKK